jgi:hypothetical protein
MGNAAVPAVAADQPVTSDQPHIAGPGDRVGGRFRDLLFVLGRRAVAGVRKQDFQLLIREPDHLEIVRIRAITAPCFSVAGCAGAKWRRSRMALFGRIHAWRQCRLNSAIVIPAF